MTRRSARLILMAGAGLTGLALAGCSSSAPPAPSPQPAQSAVSASPAALLSQAADATTNAGSARVTSTSTISGSLINTTIRAEGVVNFPAKQIDLKMQMDLMGQNQQMEIIVTGDHTYLKMPMLGGKWIDAPVQDLGVDYTDPTSSLEQLKSVADLKEVGTDTVDGVEATKYTGTVDIDKALTQAGVTGDQLEELRGQLDQAGVKTAGVTIWVDTEGRVIKADQTMSFDPGQGSPMEIKTSTTFSDFGVQTDIQAPPNDQVTSLDDLKQSGLVPTAPDSSGA